MTNALKVSSNRSSGIAIAIGEWLTPLAAELGLPYAFAGVLIGLSPDPGRWDTPEYQAEEARVRQHLGADLFFDRNRPSEHFAVPAWDS